MSMQLTPLKYSRKVCAWLGSPGQVLLRLRYREGICWPQIRHAFYRHAGIGTHLDCLDIPQLDKHIDIVLLFGYLL